MSAVNLSYRENFFRAMRRRDPEFVPFTYVFTGALVAKLRQETGRADIERSLESRFYHARNGLRKVVAEPTKNMNDHSKYYSGGNLSANAIISEWGVAHQPDGYMHCESPLADISGIHDIENYPAPDLGRPYRWQNKKAEVDALHAGGFIVKGDTISTYETARSLRGPENFLVDIYENRLWCEALIEKIFNVNMERIENMVPTGIDVLFLGDDVGAQQSMMFAPQIWRDLFKPRFRSYIALAKKINPEILVFYHSDGNIFDIIPDLIEIGLDILNPVQPECMDPLLVKKEFGKHLSFWGTIGTQTTMPFGSVADVKGAAKKMIAEVGRGGGLCLAPTHVLEPDVPLKNIKALIEAVEEYGKAYR